MKPTRIAGRLLPHKEREVRLLEFIDWVMVDCEALLRDNRLLSITLDILNKPSCKIVEQWVIQIDTQYQQDDPPSAFGAMIEKIQLDQVLEIALRDKAVVPGNERDISIMLGTLPCHTNGLDTKYIRNIFYTTDMMKVSCSTVQEC
uniref:HORMA domain-containing protein n=1 Tax=Anopheles culicifacies TaxID=139723 RepID=A0A182M7J3_9DIPT